MVVTVNAEKRIGAIEPYWTKCVGSCHAATALRDDWRRQLALCRRELGFEYVRFHGLLDDDMSVCLRARDGSLDYSFFNVDSIFDFLLSIGMKPFIELGFVPEALASGSTTVFHYKGNITPPRSYDEWGELVGRLAEHLVARYGLDEVRSWYFEVWNEPNLDIFWAGSMEQYFELYEYAARAIKTVNRTLRVGGPSTAMDAWIPEFRRFCEERAVPVDFISTHHYPTDACYGLGLDMEAQMSQSPRGGLLDRVQKARSESGPLPLYYTEWNNSPSPRDPYHDTPYSAAFVVKTIVDNLGVVEIYSFWTFSDIFEEAGLSSMPFHGGFGLLTIHGVRKPTYRAFEFLAKLVGDRLETSVTAANPTVECVSSRDRNGITVLLTNHQLPLLPVEAVTVTLRVASVNEIGSIRIERVDEAHANPKRAWVEMGSPTYPSADQIAAINRASEVHAEVAEWTRAGENVELAVTIEPHSVVAVRLE